MAQGAAGEVPRPRRPGHGWKYGTSVRVSAERDVFLEEVKDSAIAIYSRDVALRYNDRNDSHWRLQRALGGRAAELAARYDLDYLVVETRLPLPSPTATRGSRSIR